MKAATQMITETTTYADFPEIAEAEDILAKLLTNIAEVSGRKNELIHRTIEDAKSVRTRAQVEQKLIDGALTLSADPDKRAIDTVFAREIEELGRKEWQLNRAIELQGQRLNALRYDAGAQISKVFVPKHRDLQRRVGLSLITLLQAVEAEYRFVEGIRERGIEAVSSYLPLSVPRGKFGLLREIAMVNDVAGYLMRSLVDSGALTQAEVEKAAKS